MKPLTAFVCLCALALTACASGNVGPRKGISLQEARSLCITYTGSDSPTASCGGAAHQDICDTYMDPLPDMQTQQQCLDHCQQAWETLYHRYTGIDCGPQVPQGKEYCRQYCMSLPK